MVEREVKRFTGKGDLKKRLTKLFNPNTDQEKTIIQNNLNVMKFFGLSYTELMEMPYPAYIECLKYMKELEEEQDKNDKKKTLGK